MLLVPGRPGGPSSTSGNTITLSDLKGKVVLLNFWATWCGPGKEEILHFNKAYVQYEERGLYILGVSIDRGENLVRRFLDHIALF